VLFLGDAGSAPALLWARRVGVGIQLTVRADLSRSTVSLSYPPELGIPPDVVEVGGHALSVGLLLPLEW
jgi:hypothetical protein